MVSSNTRQHSLKIQKPVRKKPFKNKRPVCSTVVDNFPKAILTLKTNYDKTFRTFQVPKNLGEGRLPYLNSYFTPRIRYTTATIPNIIGNIPIIELINVSKPPYIMNSNPLIKAR